MSLSLAKLVALVQDQVQKSFEYSEHMSVVGRDSDQSDLRMNLSEAEVELPIEFGLDEVGVSSDHLKKLITEGNSIDIANKLLSLPSLNKEFEFALKDRMTIDKVSKVHFEQENLVEDKISKRKARTNVAKDFTLLEMLADIHAERLENLQWDELERRKFVLLTVANLKPKGTAVEKQDNFSGRISLKFKVVIK